MSDETTKPQNEATPEVVDAAVEDPAQEDVPVEEPVVEEASVISPSKTYKEKLAGMNELQAGQTVRLHERIKDVSPKGEERERIQVFEGMILALGGKGISRTITLRKISDGVGVEKIYPINSPVVAKIELVKTARVRQAKLGYLKSIKRHFKRKLEETYTELGMEKKKK